MVRFFVRNGADIRSKHSMEFDGGFSVGKNTKKSLKKLKKLFGMFATLLKISKLQ